MTAVEVKVPALDLAWVKVMTLDFDRGKVVSSGEGVGVPYRSGR